MECTYESANANKMPHVNIFLEKFVLEMKDLMERGIYVKEKLVNVIINALVCDAPARSDLKSFATVTLTAIVKGVNKEVHMLVGMLF